MSSEPGKRYSYRNLIVWNKAQALAIAVIDIVQRLPNTWVNGVLARQIIASATSVGANIAEGHGRYTPGAHRNHLSIARGSATETDSWLDLLRRKGIIEPEEEQSLHQEYAEILALLTSKMRDLERMSGSKPDRISEVSETYDLPEDADLPLYPFLEEDYRLI